MPISAKRFIASTTLAVGLCLTGVANANSGAMVFAYPSNLTQDLNAFSQNASTLNLTDKTTPIKVFATKVYDISYTNGTAELSLKIGQCQASDPFYNGCLKSSSPFANPTDSSALINAVAGNYPLTKGNALTIANTLFAHNISDDYSSLTIDAEMLPNGSGTTANRQGFYSTLFGQFNGKDMPVQVYINPTYFTVSDATFFSQYIDGAVINKSTGGMNLYLIPLFGGEAANKVETALTNIKGAPFKLIASVDEGENITAQITLIKALFANGTPQGFKGIDYYQYAKGDQALSSDDISQINAIVDSSAP